MSARQRGFTLIELLIVVVVIGLLAALAVPKYQDTKRKGYIAEMKVALRRQAMEMESRYADLGSYEEEACSDLLPCGFPGPAALVGLSLSVAVEGATGWRATAIHGSAPGAQCSIAGGTALVPGLPSGVPGGPNCK